MNAQSALAEREPIPAAIGKQTALGSVGYVRISEGHPAVTGITLRGDKVVRS
jgi:hypothetical protein